MAQKSWHLSRRTFLRGAGVALALPYLDAMAPGREAQAAPRPRRLCCIFFANGVSLPPPNHPAHNEWNWFPHGEGRDYRFTNTLQPLAPHRDHLSILGGLSHPLSRDLVAHATADVWLTGGDVRGTNYRNGISLDQRYAQLVGIHTRFPSLVLSSSGGVGFKTRSATISFDHRGEAIPAESQPRLIFQRLFAAPEGSSIQHRRATLRRDRLLVDRVLDDSRSLHTRLGADDRRKLDEYLDSLQEIERRIGRAESWLDVERPHVDPSEVNLDATQSGPRDYLRAMFDLITLALRTDTSRSIAFQLSQEDGMGLSDRFPGLALGRMVRNGSHHGLSHATNTPEGYADWARYDRFLAEQFAYFLEKLRAAPERDGDLLDHTVVLYGSATSNAHVARNYPLVLAGGSRLGFRHGQFRKFTERVPMSNLFVTLLDRLGAPAPSFADSTGDLPDALR